AESADTAIAKTSKPPSSSTAAASTSTHDKPRWTNNVAVPSVDDDLNILIKQVAAHDF
ncbi:MAG: hypothetical protein ACI92S_001257, partial [Planctomycetaceae bacterium]